MNAKGSYALGTIIRPVNDGTYDADILLFMEYVRGKNPRDYIEDLHALSQHGTSTLPTSCVERPGVSRLEYAGDFFLDIVPLYRTRRPTVHLRQRTRLSSRPRTAPAIGNGSIERPTSTNGHLKGTVRLLKYLRDHKDNFEVPSVLLTTLAGHSVHVNERGKRFGNLPDTLKTVSNRINSFLQATPRMPRMRNPALRSERFTRHWDGNDYRNFQEKFAVYNSRINDAYDEPNPQGSLRKWRVLFGERFLIWQSQNAK